MKCCWLCAVVGLLSLSALASAADGIVISRTSFQSGGRSIRVETFLPGGAGRHPAVVMLYGSGGAINGKGEMVALSRKLASEGMAVFLVHYFNRTRTWFANDDRITRHWRTWAATVHEAVDFVERHPRVDASSIGLSGYSLGAYLAVTEGSRNKKIDAIVERAGGLFDETREQLKWLPPTLILHGALDQRVPPSRARELERHALRVGRKVEVHLYEEEPHVFSKEALDDADRRTVAFFKKHL